MQISDNYVSIFDSYGFTAIDNVTMSSSINFILMAFAPEQIYLQHGTYMLYCIYTVFYV